MTGVQTFAHPLMTDLALSDFQLGLLGGPAFAILYTTITFPIARLAERHNRITIISLAFSAWSIMTALCGLAGSFVQLLLCRAGVSVGEELIVYKIESRIAGDAFGVGGPARPAE